MSIQTKIHDTADLVAQSAAQTIATLIRKKPNAVIGLATGSTPVKTYAELIHLHRENNLSFAKVTTFNLDEYWGLDGDHNQSYRHFMQDLFFNRIDICTWNTHVPNGKAVDPALEGKSFEAQIRASGGVDLWLLGIGHNGHIAFNEPGSTINSRTRQVDLTQTTIEANTRFFQNQDDVPRKAITAGIATILDARQILLLATGSAKANAIKQALQDQPTSQSPASFLQTHANCTFMLDKEAASQIA
ncbi:MAG: glucosamine-6-phosphate deaminase [Candidatus Latescibacteria bacterium]|jgi:glucosamine-6-phosphate deaminase|nr:glucosamine-6-phosphate deaminase [Candidatus Latescibacterota bacterium]